MHTKTSIIPIFVLAAIVCLSSPGLAGWVTSALDIPPEGLRGIMPSHGAVSDIAVDSLGNVHITHVDATNSRQRYVTNSAGTWGGKTIENYESSKSTILIDSKNRVHLCSLKINADSNLELVHATNKSKVWSVSSIVIDTMTITNFGYGNQSIYMDDLDNLHVAYIIKRSTSYGDDIRYATNRSGSWTVSDVYSLEDHYSVHGNNPSLVVDSTGKAHIAFREAGPKVKYATNAPGDFSVTDVYQGGEWLINPSIALDRFNKPGIAFMGKNMDTKKVFLKFAKKTSGDWETENVDYYDHLRPWYPPVVCSLLIDSRSKAHISYEYITDIADEGKILMYAVKYASNADGGWQTSFIDNDSGKGFTNIMFSMKGPSMAMDSSDNLYVSYTAGYGNQGITSSIYYRIMKYATTLRPSYDSTGKWTYRTSGNWFGGAAGCTGDAPDTVSGSLNQEGRSVAGIFSGITSKGYVGGSEYELYAKFPEAGGGVTKMLTYLSATSRTTASGTILWFWDGDRPCYGGSRIDMTKTDGEIVLTDYPESENPTPSISPVISILLRDR